MPKIDVSTDGLNKLAEQSRAVRSKFEPGWFLNLAFFNGDQWVFWNRGRLDKPNIPKHRMLVTDNRILPVIETRVAKKVKQKPVWSVTPNSPDDADIAASELGELVMEDRWKGLHMHDKLMDVLRWSDICAAGFWKVCWDKTLGDKATFIVDDQGQPQQGPDGQLLKLPPGMQVPDGIQTKEIAQGDIVLEVRSPFQILPDPLAKTLEECEWVIEEVVHSSEWVKAHYGVDLDGDTEATAGPADARYFTSQGGSGTYRGVKVMEFWAKPSSQFPKGKHVVWAKEQILDQGDNPYDCLPYVMFRGAPTPGRFWPTCIVDQLRGPQIELNKVKSQIAENGQRIGNPALLKSRLANISYSGVPGEEIEYDDTTQNAAPAYLQPPSMPPYVLEQQDRIEQSFREISGQHEVSGGQVPAGVTAASAINLLLEQDDTRLGPAIYDLENALGESGRMVLGLVARHYSDERMLRLAGEDGDWDIQGFKGESLRSNIAVEVQAGSAFPASKAAKQAAMTNMLTLFVQNGVPLDPRMLRKFFRDYQVGGLDTLFDDLSEDTRQVKRENRLMYGGQQLPINSFDDDEFHIAEHRDEQKTARYARAMQKDPRVAVAFEQHVQQHVDRQQKAAQEQAAQGDPEAAAKAQLQQQQAQQKAQLSNQDAQQKGALSEQDQQFELERLRIQAHYDALNQQRQAQAKLREIEAQNKAKVAQAAQVAKTKPKSPGT